MSGLHFDNPKYRMEGIKPPLLTKRPLSNRFHDLRHTYASHLAMRGVHIRALQELLGHKTLAMTQRYFHLAPEQLQNAVKLLDGVIGEQREFVGQAAT